MENVIKKIRQLRNEKGYSQTYIAGKIGISQRAYSKIEQRETKITLKRLKSIAAILEVEMADLLS